MAVIKKVTKCSKCGYAMKENGKCPRCGTIVQCCMSCSGNCQKCSADAMKSEKK
ncbi:MAG: hypothetical protein ACYCYE_12485 [Clostridia bacterium]